MTNPASDHDHVWVGRYRLDRGRFRWHVMAGTGTRPIAKFFRWKAAERMVQALRVAFFDGKYVGENKLQPREFTR